MINNKNIIAYSIIAMGVFAISTSSIFVRWAEDVPSIIVAVYRLSIAATLMSGYSIIKKERFYDLSGGKELFLILSSGTALALHFLFWVESLRLTSIASSVVLVSTSPIWTAFIARFILKEQFNLKQIIGISVTIIGIIVITLSTRDFENSSFVGNSYAVIGGIMAAIYLSIGRVLRRKKSTTSYSTNVYLASAFVLIFISLFTEETLTGYSNEMYILLLLMGIVPQLLGHTSFNWALKKFSPVTVSVAMLGEPIGATFLGIIIFSEIPVPMEIVGAIILLTGIYVTTKATGDKI